MVQEAGEAALLGHVKEVEHVGEVQLAWVRHLKEEDVTEGYHETAGAGAL